MYSLVVPVYKNRDTLRSLGAAVTEMASQLDQPLEWVCVVDGSPDDSHAILSVLMNEYNGPAQLINLSRNFGAFAAIRTGLDAARGDYIGVMAADMQEPPSLVTESFSILAKDDADIVIGQRAGREDPLVSRFFSNTFWWLYRKFVMNEIPPGGVDVFSCNRKVRDAIVMLKEGNSTLIGLLFWVGFRRKTVAYTRRERTHGKSAWRLSRKLAYMFDSIYAFSNLPIHLFTFIGITGSLLSAAFAAVVLTLRLLGKIEVPGYTPVVLLILISMSVNMLSVGVLGGYIWRTFENTKSRPGSIVESRVLFDANTQ